MSDANTEQPVETKTPDKSMAIALTALTLVIAAMIISGVKPLIAPMLKDNDSLRNWVGIASWLFVLGAAGWVMLWRQRVKRKWLLIVFLLLWAGTYSTIERAVMLRHRAVQFVATDGSPLPIEQDFALRFQCGVFSPTSGPGWCETQSLHITDAMEMQMKTYAFTTLAALLPTLALGFALRLRDKRTLSKETL